MRPGTRLAAGWRRVCVGSVLAMTAALPVAVAAEVAGAADLPAEPAFWQRLETLPPTPRGDGYLRDTKPGQYVPFRFPVPQPRPAAYRVSLDNIVSMSGKGTSYQVEIHVDAPDGPLLYKGAVFTNGDVFNAEDLSRLDALPLLTDRHVAQGYLDVFATAWVEGDTWTTYRDQDGSRWDLCAWVPEPTALARWLRLQADRAALAARGVFLLPHPKQVELRPTDLPLREGGAVAVEPTATADTRHTAEQLAAELSARTGRRLAVVTEPPRAGAVRLVVAADRARLAAAAGFDPGREVGAQGYVLDVQPGGAVVAATAEAGLFLGTQTLGQLLAGRGADTVLRAVRIVDWPDLANRMVQYDIARGNTVNVEYWKRWIRELSRLKVNQLMLYMEDDYRFDKHPYLGRPDTFTPAKARELVAFAREWHVDLVPQIESLGHADTLLSHPELADLRLAGGAWAICPLAERTLPVLGELYAELATAFPQSPLFHVGGDEVWGFAADPRCAARVKEVGEEGVYADHINNLQKLLAQRGRVLAFWGDEVLSYPRVADTLTRDAVVFDWHYGNQPSYPSLDFFREHGFTRIYVCPAVHGYFDVYPQYRQAFANIAGFTRAGVEHGVEGACCTTWGMNRGGNAENYLYGLAYAAQCAWNADETERGPFDDRFAAVWLGLAEANGARDDIDRAFWFVWRGPLEGPFWQRLFTVSELLFSGATEIVDKRSEADLARLDQEAVALRALCDEADAATGRLRQRATRNPATLDALQHAVSVHRHVAGKLTSMARLHRDYRAAYVAKPREPKALAAALDTACRDLRASRAEFAGLEAGLETGIRERGGDPADRQLLLAAARRLDADLARFEKARADLAAGRPPPDPLALGLGPRQQQRIGQWTTADTNPSSRQQPRRLVLEVSGRLTTPGTYEVEWDYTEGEDGLDVLSTGLFVSTSPEPTPTDLQPVVVDEHHAFTGAADRDNRYRLVVDRLPEAPGSRLFVVGTVYNQRTFNTRGDVWLRRGWDE